MQMPDLNLSQYIPYKTTNDCIPSCHIMDMSVTVGLRESMRQTEEENCIMVATSHGLSPN